MSPSPNRPWRNCGAMTWSMIRCASSVRITAVRPRPSSMWIARLSMATSTSTPLSCPRLPMPTWSKYARAKPGTSSARGTTRVAISTPVSRSIDSARWRRRVLSRALRRLCVPAIMPLPSARGPAAARRAAAKSAEAAAAEPAAPPPAAHEIRHRHHRGPPDQALVFVAALWTRPGLDGADTGGSALRCQLERRAAPGAPPRSPAGRERCHRDEYKEEQHRQPAATAAGPWTPSTARGGRLGAGRARSPSASRGSDQVRERVDRPRQPVGVAPGPKRRREVVANDAPRVGIGHLAFQAIADLDPDLAFLDRDQQQNPVVASPPADFPRFLEANGEIVDRHAAEIRKQRDRDLVGRRAVIR